MPQPEVEHLANPSSIWMYNTYKGSLIQVEEELDIYDVGLDDLIDSLLVYQSNEYIDSHISYEVEDDCLSVTVVYWRECTEEELIDLAARRANAAQKAAQKELELLEREQKEYIRLKTKYEPHLLE